MVQVGVRGLFTIRIAPELHRIDKRRHGWFFQTVQRHMNKIVIREPESSGEGGARFRPRRVDLTNKPQRLVKRPLALHVGSIESEIALT